MAATLSLAWTAGLLLALASTGASVGLRTWAASLAEPIAPDLWRDAATLILYVTMLGAALVTGGAPTAFYSGFALERRYALSNEPFRRWLRDEVESLGVAWLLAIVLTSVLYGCIRRWPDGWWLPAGGAFALMVAGLSHVGPVALLPLFYRVRPLQQETLQARLLALAERTGTPVLGAYEWSASEKTRKANAALAGLMGTRRILVSDTMLREYSDDEIEVVLAHELAHHVHGDLWKGMVFESALVLGGLLAASRVLRAWGASAGLRGPDDVAGLPLLVLSAGAVVLVMRPVVQAISRASERRADRFAIELTANPMAFVSAIRRLGARNLAEEQPSRVVQWIFCDHPPVGDRIAAAQAFNRGGAPPIPARRGEADREHTCSAV